MYRLWIAALAALLAGGVAAGAGLFVPGGDRVVGAIELYTGDPPVAVGTLANPLPVSATVTATSSITAIAALPTLAPGAQTPQGSLAGAAYVQPVFSSTAGGGTQVDATHGLPANIIAGVSIGATGSAPPASAGYLGANASGATGGLLKGLITCDSHAKYDASDNGSKTLVTGVSGRKVYVCGYILANGGTATNLKLREGSDADCATNGADLTPAYQLVANDKIGFHTPFWTGLAVSTNAYYVCINASAGNAHQGEIWYTIL